MAKEEARKIGMLVSNLKLAGVLLGFAALPVAYLIYVHLMIALILIPLYFVVTWFLNLHFDVAVYFLFALTLNWVWDSFSFVRLFVVEVVLGIKTSDISNSLSSLNEFKGVSVYLFCVGMSLLYLNPFVLWMNQNMLTTELLSLPRAALISLDQFLDVLTLNLISNYDIHITVIPIWKPNFFARTYTFLTNAGFSIVTIALVWGGMRALFLPSKGSSETSATIPETNID